MTLYLILTGHDCIEGDLIKFQGTGNALIFKRGLCQPRNFITSRHYILYYFFLDTQYILIYLSK